MSYLAELRAHYAAVDARLGVQPKRREPAWEERRKAVVLECAWPYEPDIAERMLGSGKAWKFRKSSPASQAKALARQFRRESGIRTKPAAVLKEPRPIASNDTTINGFLNDPKQMALRIIEEEAERSEVSVGDVMGKSALGPVVAVRHRCMQRVYNEVPKLKSYKAVSRLFGRNHTTVMHALGRKKRYYNAKGTVSDKAGGTGMVGTGQEIALAVCEARREGAHGDALAS